MAEPQRAAARAPVGPLHVCEEQHRRGSQASHGQGLQEPPVGPPAVPGQASTPPTACKLHTHTPHGEAEFSVYAPRLWSGTSDQLRALPLSSIFLSSHQVMCHHCCFSLLLQCRGEATGKQHGLFTLISTFHLHFVSLYRSIRSSWETWRGTLSLSTTLAFLQPSCQIWWRTIHWLPLRCC